MRCAVRCTARCMRFSRIGSPRWSRPRCSRSRSWSASPPRGRGSPSATARCGMPGRSRAGPARIRSRRKACHPRPPCCSRSSPGTERRERSPIRTPRSPCMVALPKRRPSGRRVTAARYRIRPARAADVADVVAIERATFSDPWSANDFEECIASGVPFLVAEQRGAVLGYAIAHWAADEAEILNVGVAPAYRRQGVGRALVERMLAALHDHGARVVYLEVRESNVIARRLYESLGFTEVARRACYYRRPVEDAVILRAAIPAGQTGQASAKLRS